MCVWEKGRYVYKERVRESTGRGNEHMGQTSIAKYGILSILLCMSVCSVVILLFDSGCESILDRLGGLRITRGGAFGPSVFKSRLDHY